jgi:cholesterol transport system auxiliary component
MNLARFYRLARRMIQLTALSACGLLAGACSVIPRGETLTVYRLPTTMQATAPVAGKPMTVALRIATPRASVALDSTRIAVLPAGDEVAAYQAARWSDRAPVLLRNRLFDAFQASGAVAALSLDENNLQADLELGGEWRIEAVPELLRAVRALPGVEVARVRMVRPDRAG